MAAGVNVLVNSGTGFTVTTTLYVAGFEHPLANNAYTYVTFTGEGVVFMRVSFGLPAPAPAALLIPATTARVHAKLVPEVPLVGVYENRELLQMAGASNKLVNAGIGFTTTSLLYTAELHPFAVRI